MYAPIIDLKTKSDEFSFYVSLEMARYFADSFKEDGRFVSEEILSYKEDTLAYLYNYKDGWKLISADRRTEPILASEKRGCFSIDKIDNPGVSLWLDSAMKQIMVIRRDGAKQYDEETYKMWDAIHDNCVRKKMMNEPIQTKTYIDSLDGDYPYYIRKWSQTSTIEYTMNSGHLIQTKWGQGNRLHFWNQNMLFGWSNRDSISKRCVLGFFPVAVSQMLYYLHYKIGKPSGLYHNISTYGYKIDKNNGTQGISRGDFTYPSPRWDQMAKDSFEEHIDYVGDFIIDVGFRMGTKYSADESSANLSTSHLSNFGITFDQSEYVKSTVYNQIIQDKPTIVTAFHTYSFFSGFDGGHAWIIDGWIKKRYNYLTTYQWIVIGSRNDEENIDWSDHSITRYSYEDGLLLSGGDEYTYSSGQTSEFDYLLMNWGWDNRFDDAEYSANTADYWTISYTNQSGEYVSNTYKFDVNICFNFRSNGLPETAL